jgi:hypothetical protein
VGIADFVRRDEPRPHDVARIEVLALRRAQTGGIFAILRIPGTHVVEDAIAVNVLERPFARNALSCRSNDHAELELEVEFPAVARPENVRVGSDHAEPIALVIDRYFVTNRGNLELIGILQFQLGRDRIGIGGSANFQRTRLLVVKLEVQKVAHLLRTRQQREEANFRHRAACCVGATARNRRRNRFGPCAGLGTALNQRKHRVECRRGFMPKRLLACAEIRNAVAIVKDAADPLRT